MSVNSGLPAVYDPKSRKWVFTRQYGQGTILRPLGSVKIHISPPNTSSHHSLSGKNANGAGTLHVDRARKWSRYLMHDIPELAPALNILPDLIEESHIITASTEVNDPTMGRQMDVGSAAIVGGAAGMVKTLAYATGVAGSEVGLAGIVDEEFTFQDDEERGELRLVAPGLDVDMQRDRQREAAYSVVGEVRQVCTAKGDNNPLLAVRTATSSTILTQEYTSHNFKFTLNPLLTIPISETPHSDLAFSPYNPRHLSIVDERGAWLVHDIHHSQYPKPIATGSELVNTPDGHSWGKIHWGADSNSLIVSNRARVGLFDIRAQPPGLSFLPINTSITRDWVLDTALVPAQTNPHHAIILTTSSLLWVDTRIPGKRLLSQDHFRHSDDVSLKMELFSLPGNGGEEFTALVYSRMNPLVSAFQMGYSEVEGGGGGGVPVWLDNPYLWNMDMDGWGVKGGPLSLSILPARVEMGNGEGGDRSGRGVVGVSCWSYKREGVVRSQVYTSGGLGEPIPICGHDYDVTQKQHIGELDSVDLKQSPWDNNTPRLIHTDFSPLYKYIFTDTFSDPTLKTAEGGSEIEGFKTQLQRLLSTEEGGDADSVAQKDIIHPKGVKTLFDLHRPQHLFGDLAGLSAYLKDLLTVASQRSNVEVTNNLIPFSEGFPFREGGGHGDEDGEASVEGDDDILSLYNHLFTTYASPLPLEAPTRVRLHRERLARMIATELYLASQGILTTNPTSSSHTTNSPSTPEPIGVPTPSIEEEQPPLFTTLQKYTPLTNHPSPSALPSTLSRILDQWHIGEDPEDFGYGADGVSTPKKSTKSRPRSHGKKVRGGRGEKESGGGEEVDAGRGLSMFGGTKPVMFAVSSSASVQTQPTTPSRGGGGWEQMPMTPKARTQSPEKSGMGVVGGSISQIERGKFGGRKGPPVKKKRKQGF